MSWFRLYQRYGQGDREHDPGDSMLFDCLVSKPLDVFRLPAEQKGPYITESRVEIREELTNLPNSTRFAIYLIKEWSYVRGHAVWYPLHEWRVATGVKVRKRTWIKSLIVRWRVFAQRNKAARVIQLWMCDLLYRPNSGRLYHRVKDRFLERLFIR